MSLRYWTGFRLIVLSSFIALVLLPAAGCGGRSSGAADHGDEEHGEHGAEGHDEHSEETDVIELQPDMLDRVTIRTVAVERRLLLPELVTTGRVGFDENRLAHVAPRIPGRVDAVRADLGDDVTAGQVLAVLDSIELGMAQAAFLEARAQEELARRNLEREEGLRAENISSERDLLTARATHEEATARLRAARETLRLYGLSDAEIEALRFDGGLTSLLAVRAPMRGRVVEKHVTTGELVGPQAPIFTIADLDMMWIWIDIYERDLRHVHNEDLVEVTVDAYPDDTFSAKVAYVSDQVDTDTRTVRARIDVRNEGRKLRAGMFARVRITDPHATREAEHAEPVLVIPRSAVQRDDEGPLVFVREQGTRFERRRVDLGTTSGGLVAVLSGVEEGEQVVIEGAFLLKSEASKDELEPEHGH